MKPYYIITILSLFGLGFMSPMGDDLRQNPNCYQYGTPGTKDSGVVCPYAENATNAENATTTPQATLTATPTAKPSNTPTIMAVTSTPELSLPWFEGDTVGVIADDIGRSGNATIFVNSYTGEGMSQYPNGQYGTVDMTGKIPPDAKGVFLSGILIITHGTTAETCDLQISFRRDETVPEWAYIGQSVEAHIGGGQRQPMFELLPVKNGKMQFKWYGSTVTAGNYPDHCAYGINFRLAGYVK